MHVMTSTPPAHPGRPRDPEVSQRIREAAISVFAEHGWAGFSIDAVSRASQVGKASIYLRWSSKEDLLTEAVAEAFDPIREIDTGTLRGDLIALATLLLELYEDDTRGRAARRMVVESQVTPGIARRWSLVREAQVRTTRRIVRRAVDRGDLPPGAPTTLIVDTLCGAAMLRPVAVPSHLHERANRLRARHAHDLVDFVLAGAIARSSP